MWEWRNRWRKEIYKIWHVSNVVNSRIYHCCAVYFLFVLETKLGKEQQQMQCFHPYCTVITLQQEGSIFTKTKFRMHVCNENLQQNNILKCTLNQSDIYNMHTKPTRKNTLYGTPWFYQVQNRSENKSLLSKHLLCWNLMQVPINT